jgi:hypothetical protein
MCSTACAEMREHEKERMKGRWWAQTFVLKQHTHGAYQSIQNELKIVDRQGFKNLMRMFPYDFGNLLKMVAPLIKLQATNCRNGVSPAKRLAATLQF